MTKMEFIHKKRISVIRYVLKILYPLQNSYLLFIYLVVKHIIDTKRCSRYNEKNIHNMGLNAKVIPREIIKKIVKNNLSDAPYDTCHQIIVPEYYFNDLYSENIYFRDGKSLWMSMRTTFEVDIFPWLKSPNNYDAISNIDINVIKKRSNDANDHNELIVQIVPFKNMEEDVAYMNEEVYFNITKRYKTRLLFNKSVNIHLLPIKNMVSAPQIADVVIIEMVKTSHEISTELVYIILEKYFSVPKFLHKNDCFGIPLTEKYMKHLYFKYLDIANDVKTLYFICKQLNNKRVLGYEEEKRIKINDSIGYFVVKGITDLIQEQNVHSFIPSKKSISIESTNLELNNQVTMYPYIDACPFGLENSLLELEKSVLPFLIEKEVNPFHAHLKCVIQPIFLLRGIKGSGRLLLAKLLAEYSGMNFISSNCRQLSASTSKQAEAKLDALIQKAKNSAPVVVFLEDFEIFGVDAENNENIRLIENFSIKLKVLFEIFTKQPIIIIAGCDINAELKPNLARIFIEELRINTLSSDDRFGILHWMVLLKNILLCDADFQPMKDDFDENNCIGNYVISNVNSINDCRLWKFNNESKSFYEEIASKMETYLYDDIDSLIHLVLRSAFMGHEKHLLELPGPSADDKVIKPIVGLVRKCDFEIGLETLRSTYSKKLTPLKVPDVKWEEIGGLEDLKKEIYRTIELPIKFPHLLTNSGLKRSGILLWGPPGCGKTLVARAIASQLQANFLSVKGPELLDMYVGQSEKNMREIFAAARSSAPCVIFFDEAEAAAGARGASGDSGGAADRLVSQLLAELDGVAAQDLSSGKGSVVVVAATNRPDLVEPALLRPGRLDKLLYVGPYEGQVSKVRVLKASCHGYNLGDSVELPLVADELPEKCTGADLASIAKRARHLALKKIIKRAETGEISGLELTEKHIVIQQCDFQNALMDFHPSISEDEMNYYESLKNKLS